jgi:nucleotide-binding universal stress UspA family protein
MKVLFAYDGSNSAEAAIEDLPRAGFPEKGKALVITVGSNRVGPFGALTSITEAKSLAEDAQRRIHARLPEWTVWSEALRGQPADVLLDICGWWRPDLFVVGSHGHSRGGRFFLGSVSLELLHKAQCSVRVVRNGKRAMRAGPIRIVIGHDGSTEADGVIRSVASRSWPAETEAHIVSVVPALVPATVAALEFNNCVQEPACTVVREIDEREHQRLLRVAEDSANILSCAGLKTDFSVVDGHPQDVILAEAELSSADTIFIGARGMGSLQRLFLGSVSTYVVTHAHCAVEVVRI